jgi:hypothetical protein
MRPILMSSVAILLAAPLPARAPADEAAAPIVAMIREAVAAEDSGDPAAGRFYAPVQAITDSISPFHWHGPDARDRWMEAVARDFETRERAQGRITLGEPTIARIEGQHGYFVFPASYTFREKNVETSREATVTVTTLLDGGTWKIASWTWAGPN